MPGLELTREVTLPAGGDPAARTRALGQLRAHTGVEDAVEAEGRYTVRYDLRGVTAATIVDALAAAGVLGASTVTERLRRALACYREAVLREDLSNEIGWDSFVREIYVSRYRHRRHGRRDDRPRHWRQYSARRDTPRTGPETNGQ